LRRLGCIDLFFAILFWEKFGRFLIVADGFQDMLINSVLQSTTAFIQATQIKRDESVSQSLTKIL